MTDHRTTDDRCPTCGSYSPRYAVTDPANPSLDVCADPWHDHPTTTDDDHDCPTCRGGALYGLLNGAACPDCHPTTECFYRYAGPKLGRCEGPVEQTDRFGNHFCVKHWRPMTDHPTTDDHCPTCGQGWPKRASTRPWCPDEHHDRGPDDPEVCGSIGPRIGNEGAPRCGLPLGHGLPHQGFPGSGWENETWGDPVLRDHKFLAEYHHHSTTTDDLLADFHRYLDGIPIPGTSLIPAMRAAEARIRELDELLGAALGHGIEERNERLAAEARIRELEAEVAAIRRQKENQKRRARRWERKAEARVSVLTAVLAAARPDAQMFLLSRHQDRCHVCGMGEQDHCEDWPILSAVVDALAAQGNPSAPSIE